MTFWVGLGSVYRSRILVYLVNCLLLPMRSMHILKNCRICDLLFNPQYFVHPPPPPHTHTHTHTQLQYVPLHNKSLCKNNMHPRKLRPQLINRQTSTQKFYEKNTLDSNSSTQLDPIVKLDFGLAQILKLNPKFLHAI